MLDLIVAGNKNGLLLAVNTYSGGSPQKLFNSHRGLYKRSHQEKAL